MVLLPEFTATTTLTGHTEGQRNTREAVNNLPNKLLTEQGFGEREKKKNIPKTGN